MMLLHWQILAPHAPGGLAAIRFSPAVRIQAVRIFPTGARPFAHSDAVARTEPAAFHLNVYFNAQAVTPAARQRQKGVINALVPTRLAYVGGPLEFATDMGPEYSTRLMVVQGDFESLSLAVYGTVVAEAPSLDTPYEPQPLPTFEPVPLSRVLDPANSDDPAALSRALLDLVPDSPALDDVIPRTLRQRPGPNGHLADRDVNMASGNALQDMFDKTMAGAAIDDIDDGLAHELSRPAALGASQLALIAGIIRNVAKQQPMTLHRCLSVLKDSRFAFGGPDLSADVVGYLSEASAHLDVATFLDTDDFLDALDSVLSGTSSDALRADGVRLRMRINGWMALTDSLLNTRGDFQSALLLLEDVSQNAESLAMWLHCMIGHPDVLDKLADNPALSDPIPPLASEARTSHDAFMSYVRGCVGVGGVVVALLWADSADDGPALERVLGIIRLWQTCPGYKEILGRVLLLPAVLVRLEDWVHASTLSSRGVVAEQILATLSSQPASYLTDYRDVVHELGRPMIGSTEANHELLLKATSVAESGLVRAFDELRGLKDAALDGSQIVAVRVALSAIQQELQRRSDDHTPLIAAVWHEHNSLMDTLAQTISALADILVSQFSAATPPTLSPDPLSQTFLASEEVLKVTLALLPSCPVPGRLIRSFAARILDVFVCTDAADLVYSHDSTTSAAAQKARRVCVDLACSLSRTGSEGSAAIQVIRTLFQAAPQSFGDPAAHLAQAFYLVDHILQDVIPPDSRMDDNDDQTRLTWALHVFPVILPELSNFIGMLDADSRIHIAKSLFAFDRDSIVGLGEWFISEEVQRLESLMTTLDTSVDNEEKAMLQFGVGTSVRVLNELICGSASNDWWLTAFASQHAVLESFVESLRLLTKLHLTSGHLVDLVQTLLRDISPQTGSSKEALVLALLCSAQAPRSDLNEIERIMDTVAASLKSEPVLEKTNILRCGICKTLSKYAGVVDLEISMDPEVAETVYSLMVTLEDVNTTLLPPVWMEFCDHLADALPPDRGATVKALMRERPATPGDDCGISTPPSPLTERVSIPFDHLERLLKPATPAPSTPAARSTELAPDILAAVTVSPTALLRSPTNVTGLTKTYSHNAFRDQARATPSNTGRMPSMHVDDFQHAESPPMPTTSLLQPGPLYASGGGPMV